MAPSQHQSARGRPHSHSLLLALLCLAGTACGTTPPAGKVLFEDPRGTVSLQAISDQSIQASHPINLDPALLAQVLKGLQIQDEERALQSVLAGPSSPVPVFSEDQIRFLVPLLTEGLRTAAPDQQVEYRVHTPRKGSALESSITETTTGSLYAYGLSLYVALSQYRYSPTRINADDPAHRRLPDSSGLSSRKLLFTPIAAQRSDNFHRPTEKASTNRVLAIDYQLLQRWSPSVTTPEQAAARPEPVAEPVRQAVSAAPPSGVSSNTTRTLKRHDEEIHALKDLVIKKDVELETLKKELQSIRKQLDDQTTRQDGQKRKNKPPSKSQQTIP